MLRADAVSAASKTKFRPTKPIENSIKNEFNKINITYKLQKVAYLLAYNTDLYCINCNSDTKFGLHTKKAYNFITDNCFSVVIFRIEKYLDQALN